MAGVLDNLKGKGFHTDPQNINRKGPPKKGLSLVNEQLKKKGYKPVRKQDFEENVKQLLQLNEKELLVLKDSKESPMMVRIISKALLGGKGFDALERMLNRAIGTPAQTVTGADGSLLIPTTINIIAPSPQIHKGQTQLLDKLNSVSPVDVVGDGT